MLICLDFVNKTKSNLNSKEYVDKLISLHLSNMKFNDQISLFRFLDGEIYKITINFECIENINGIGISLSNSINENLHKIFINFKKFSNFISKLNLLNSLSLDYNLNYIKSLTDFIRKIFIYNCYVISGDKPSIGLYTNSVGVIFKNTVTLGMEKCSYDLFVHNEYYQKITIFDSTKYFYIKPSESLYLALHLDTDQSSFYKLFEEIGDKIEGNIPSYKIKESATQNDGFLIQLFSNIEKYFISHNFKSFKDVCVKLNTIHLNVFLRDELQKQTLYSINHNQSNFTWKMQKYDLQCNFT